jgi:hypothetical protein
MAETVTLSPSFALNSPEPGPKVPTAIQKIARPPHPAPKHVPKASETTAIAKRKQSKSRNGMVPLDAACLTNSLQHYIRYLYY